TVEGERLFWQFPVQGVSTSGIITEDTPLPGSGGRIVCFFNPFDKVVVDHEHSDESRGREPGVLSFVDFPDAKKMAMTLKRGDLINISGVITHIHGSKLATGESPTAIFLVLTNVDVRR